MSARTLSAVALLALLPACEVTELVIDIQASHLSGAFTLDGAPFPGAQDEIGSVTLQGVDPGDVVQLGLTVDQGYDAFVVDGVYDAHYAWSDGDTLPANQDARVLAAVAVAGDADLPIEIGAVEVTVTFTLNGQPFPDALEESAMFSLQPVDGDELVPLGNSSDGSASVTVAPGVYHVIYEHVQGSSVPLNGRARVAEALVLDADQRLVVDVVASDLRLTFTLDGDAFPLSEYDDANLLLRDEHTAAESQLMNTHAPVATALVIDGTYDVIYRHETGDDVPLNTAAVVVSDFVLAGGGALVHDIVSVSVDAEVTLDGSPFPVSEYQDGTLSLYDAATKADTGLGNTHDPFVGLRLIPGVYDVLYTHETGDEVPQNVRGTVASGVAVDGSLLVVDVRSIEVTAEITLDGSPFPASEYDDANFFLAGDPSDVDLLVGSSHDASPSVRVLSGTYDLLYRHETGDEVPQNTNFRLLADQVLAADTVLATDVATRTARLWATLEGEPFPDASVGSGHLYARSGEGDEVLMVETGSVQHAPVLIAGEYELVYEYVSGSEVPENPWALVGAATIE